MKFEVRNYRVLLVDDEVKVLDLFKEFLSTEYVVETASSGEEALRKLEKREFHLVLTDLVMPGIDGLELIETIKKRWSKISIIVVSGQATVRTAVNAMKAGAEELVLKPVTDLGFVSLLIKRSLYNQWLQTENLRLNRLLKQNGKERFLGSSRKIQELLRKIKKIAPLETTILLTGETGAGKSFIAEIIHEESKRSKRKFVSINCGALTETLLESTLFGHKRGAFTGAVKDKKGLFEEADGGTLFLDEISETSGAFQVKLLNVIERGMIRNVGGEKEIKVDVRLIFASNRDLKEAVEMGKFRKDLYFRINVVNLRIPALRERKDDIIMMATAFLNEFCQKHELGKLQLSHETKEILRQYGWEGNIRELRNCIEHAAVMCEGSEVRAEHLPEYINQEGIVIYDSQVEGLSYREAKDLFEQSYFSALLRKKHGNITEAARESQLARQCVYRKLGKLGIDPRSHRKMKH